MTENITMPETTCCERLPVVPLLLKPQDAAGALQISRRKLWSLTADGIIPSVRLGRAVRYSLVDLQAAVDQLKCKLSR
jgi:excisionase family DNA binding protein